MAHKSLQVLWVVGGGARRVGQRAVRRRVYSSARRPCTRVSKPPPPLSPPLSRWPPEHFSWQHTSMPRRSAVQPTPASMTTEPGVSCCARVSHTCNRAAAAAAAAWYHGLRVLKHVAAVAETRRERQRSCRRRYSREHCSAHAAALPLTAQPREERGYCTHPGKRAQRARGTLAETRAEREYGTRGRAGNTP